MEKRECIIVYKEYSGLHELSDKDKTLVKKAKDAAHKAYAPYSKFHVGAAILLENGKVIEGNNQENAAYPSGLCAERVAMFYANAHFPESPIVAIAVTAYSKGGYIEEPVPPCGSCRQALLESELRFKKPIRIILAGKERIQVIDKIRDLLPLTFDTDFLLKY